MELYHEAFESLAKPWTLSDFEVLNNIELTNIFFFNYLMCVHRHGDYRSIIKNVHSMFLNIRTTI